MGACQEILYRSINGSVKSLKRSRSEMFAPRHSVKPARGVMSQDPGINSIACE